MWIFSCIDSIMVFIVLVLNFLYICRVILFFLRFWNFLLLVRYMYICEGKILVVDLLFNWNLIYWLWIFIIVVWCFDDNECICLIVRISLFDELFLWYLILWILDFLWFKVLWCFLWCFGLGGCLLGFFFWNDFVYYISCKFV